MSLLTLILAIAGGCAILLTKPLTGLSIYTLLMLWYPVSLWLPVGSIHWNVDRLAILALFINLWTREAHVGFRLNRADKLFLAFWCAQIISGLFTTDLKVLLINRSGTLFDTALPYFALRIILKDEASVARYVRVLAVAAVVLSLVGVFEMATGTNVMSFGRPPHMIEGRLGLERARTSFSHPIYFGLSMAALTTILMSRRRRGHPLSLLPAATAGAGTLASLSSGPALGLAAMLGVLGFYRWRRYWKTAFWVAVVMCVVIEVVSNRHFYDVVDRIAFSGRNYWYRTRLIEVAFLEGGMSGHWLFGYGYDVDPMWGLKIDGRDITDMVNYYLLILCQFGLVAIIPFVALMVTVGKRTLELAARLQGQQAWTQWCFLAALLGLLFAINSVSLFSQSHHIFYMTLSLCESYRCLISKKTTVVVRGVRKAHPARGGQPALAVPTHVE